MTTSKTEPKDTESLILEAAEREFLMKGFAGARTTTIAKAAGVTHTMFHYYFRTKEKLFERFIANKMTMVGRIISTLFISEEKSVEECVRQAVTTHFDFVKANPDLPRFMLNEVFPSPERMGILIAQVRTNMCDPVARMQQRIDHAAGKGQCRPIDAGMLILDILSLNIFAFLIPPTLHSQLCGETDRDKFLLSRKEENIETILSKLRP